MSGPGIVAVEWGTMRWRARLIMPDGHIADERRAEVALASLDRAAIAATLGDWAEAWPAAAARGMLLSGMIGSPMGLLEVPRVACRASVDAIAAGTVETDIGGLRVLILPGLSCTSRFGDPDVMRGEEVAAIAVAVRAAQATLVSVPGMHGKWIRLEDGRIRDFHTAMTVELLRAIGSATVLAPLLRTPVVADEAFARGVATAARAGGLARLLFSARAAVQGGILTEAEAGSFIAGLVIGSDVADGLTDATTPHFVGGDPAMAALFVAAIRQLGGRATVLDDGDATTRGFMLVTDALRSTGRLRDG